MTLSGLLITRDSARWLPYVLANMRSWADEVVVVVDARSSDAETAHATFETARSLADKVAVMDVGGYLERVLNQAAALCAGEWIMRVDDDELMPPDFRSDADYLMGLPWADYMLQRLHLIGDGSLMARAPALWPDPQVRLRRKQAYIDNPWPATAHSIPNGADGRLFVATPGTTIWHVRALLREAVDRAVLDARIAAEFPDQAAELGRRMARDAELPWQAFPVPQPQPAELDALLDAIGRPVCEIAERHRHRPETYMRGAQAACMTEGLHELLAVLLHNATVVEIGVFAGEATRIFAASPKVAQVYAVDNWAFADFDVTLGCFRAAEVEAAFDRVLAERPDVIRKVKTDSLSAAAQFADGSVDLVYIDANHNYFAVRADMAAWRSKVKPGGILAGHDYDKIGVRRAVDEAYPGGVHVCADASWWVRL